MCIFIYIYMHPFDSSSHCHILYTRIYLYICICTRISVTSKNFITVFGHFVLLGFAAMILETKGRNDHVVNFLFCHKENKNQSWSLPCLRMTGQSEVTNAVSRIAKITSCNKIMPESKSASSSMRYQIFMKERCHQAISISGLYCRGPPTCFANH